MSAPVYFCPNADSNALRCRDSQALTDCLLADVLRDLTDSSFSVTDLKAAGPGQQAGCIVSAWSNEPPALLGYYPQQQTWHAVGDGKQLWIGVDTLRPVTPADLLRRQIIRGHHVELADGNSWEVPVYRLVNGDYGVPYDLYRDHSGELVTEVRGEHQPLWDAAGRMWDTIMEADGSASFDFGDVLDYCVQALSVNYHLDHNLHAVLRLITSETWEDCLMATIDMPAFVQLMDEQKKKWLTSRHALELSAWKSGLVSNYSPSWCDLLYVNQVLD